MSGPEGALEPAVPDDYLLDAETKADIAKRAQLVGEVGAPLARACHHLLQGLQKSMKPAARRA